MFAIFSLRRPNILPVGDLGVQRGLARWVVSQHTSLQSPVKLSKQATEEEAKALEEEHDATMEVAAIPGPMAPPQTPRKKKNKGGEAEKDMIDPLLPIPFTPSINRVLAAPVIPTPLPPGLTVRELRSRLDGKKKIKCATTLTTDH